MAKNQLRTWTAALTRRLFSAAASPAAKPKPPPPPAGKKKPPAGKKKPPPPPAGKKKPPAGKKKPPAGKKKPPPPPAGKKKPPPPPDLRPLYQRLTQLVDAPEGAVSGTLNKWFKKKKRRLVGADRLMSYVKVLRKYGRYSHALEMIDWMEKTQFMNMPYTDHAIRLDLISKVRGIDSAEEYFNSLPETAKNQRTYGALLNCYCSEKMGVKAEALYEEMKRLNLSSDTQAHNNLMVLHMKLGHPEKVSLQFQEMKAANIAPDNLSCSILMRSYASLNDIDSVDRVIQELEEGDEVILQWSAYSTLAAIYSSAGLVKKAESSLKKLEGLIDRRDREPYHFLMSLNASLGNLEEVNRAWKSLKAIFMKPANLSYLTMLQALNKLDDIEGMKRCYNEWDSFQTSYDIRLTKTLISAYLRKGMIEEAESLLNEAVEKGASSNLRTCELFLDFFLKNQQICKAIKWLEDTASTMKERKWKLKKETVNAFLEGFQTSKDVEGAQRFCKSLKRLKCVDSDVYESLVKGIVSFTGDNSSSPAWDIGCLNV